MPEKYCNTFNAAAVLACLCGKELFNLMRNPAVVIFVLVYLLPKKIANILLFLAGIHR